MRNRSFGMNPLRIVAFALLGGLMGHEQPIPAAEPAASEVHPAAGQMPDPGATVEPALDSMTLAAAPAKLSVPVDLRFQFDGDAIAGRPVTLHLAAIPRVSGSNLRIAIKEMPGIRASAGPLSTQKASAATTYRQQLVITRVADGPKELRILVTMDLPQGSAFGWFSVPLEAPAATTKREPIKMR